MSKRQAKRNRFRQHQHRARSYETRKQAFAALTADLHPARILYLPLDIGKNVHWLRAATGAGQVLLPAQAVLSNATGYATWAQHVHRFLTSGDFDLVVAGMEPTGIYHEPWLHHIAADFAAWTDPASHPRLLLQVVNPAQTAMERQKITLRLAKSDPIDLFAIESMLQQGLGVPARPLDPHVAELRQWAYLAREAAHHLQAIHTDILRWFDRLWPGAIVNVKRFRQAHPQLPAPQPLVTSKPLERQLVKAILDLCPDPHTVRTFSEADIIALFHQHGYRCGPKTAQCILANAFQALLPDADLSAVFRQALDAHRQDADYYRQRLTAAEQALIDLVPHTPARFLATIHGITPLWAAYYLAILGDPAYFDYADQAWAYMGFDPIIKSSGDARRVQAISRRGQPSARHTLTWLACLVAGQHPRFGLTFIAAEERGKGPWGAAIHTAHRLHRTCFALLRDQQPFVDPQNPDHHVAAWHAYWIAYRQHRREPRRYPDPGPWRPPAAPPNPSRDCASRHAPLLDVGRPAQQKSTPHPVSQM